MKMIAKNRPTRSVKACSACGGGGNWKDVVTLWSVKLSCCQACQGLVRICPCFCTVRPHGHSLDRRPAQKRAYLFASTSNSRVGSMTSSHHKFIMPIPTSNKLHDVVDGDLDFSATRNAICKDVRPICTFVFFAKYMSIVDFSSHMSLLGIIEALTKGFLFVTIILIFFLHLSHKVTRPFGDAHVDCLQVLLLSACYTRRWFQNILIAGFRAIQAIVRLSFASRKR